MHSGKPSFNIGVASIPVRLSRGAPNSSTVELALCVTPPLNDLDTDLCELCGLKARQVKNM